MHAAFEAWQPGEAAPCEAEGPVAGVDDVARYFDELENAWSATLTIQSWPDRKLMLSASGGRYNAMVVLGEDVLLEFLGNRDVDSEVDVRFGGQLAPYPERYLLTRAQAWDAISQFLSDVDVSESRDVWEKR